MKHLTESEITAVCINATGFAAEVSSYQPTNHKLRWYERVDCLGQVIVKLVAYKLSPLHLVQSPIMLATGSHLQISVR